jgi:predicted nuclease of predicted toxin-antitoxin system
MKIKLDENLPLRLATLLSDFGHDLQTVHDERLVGHADTEIWEVTQRESRFLIKQDLDFFDTRQFVPGSHHGILLLRLRSPTRRDLIERIEKIFEKENVSEWAGCFVVVTEHKIRVLRPGGKQN